MARIAIGGFQHETNTFASTRAGFDEFARHDAWPALVRGPRLLEAVSGINLPIRGFMEAAREDGHELVPLTWCSAEPSSFVTEDAFERIAGMIAEDLAALGPFDAVYLDLHGAMVAEHRQDGEGEMLARVRAVVGPETPLVASLDLHANVTERMVREASAMSIYRTYPHVDMEQTGARAWILLRRLLAGERLAKAFRKAPFLVPLPAQWTEAAPTRHLYDRVMALELEGTAGVDLALAFPPADILECGPAVIAYDRDPRLAARAAERLSEALLAAEPAFDSTMLDAPGAVRAALAEPRGPVVLADAQDNPGAGARSDTVGVLEALVAQGARRAALGLLWDPEVAREAHARGVGADFEAPLGGKSGRPGQAPFRARFRVAALGDGVFDCTGEMYRGVRTDLGPVAVLAVAEADCDVSIVVSSRRFQNLDQACFRHIGIEPRRQHILAVKSTVHFRADYGAIASRTIVVESPGENPCRPLALDYRRLRQGVRLEPCGPEHRRA